MARWSPWGAVSKLPHVSIHYEALPESTGGALLYRRGLEVMVIIDERSTKAERRVLLAHELVHLERGSTTRCRHAPNSWDAVVVREELNIDREVARRLVPLDDLHEVVARVEDLGGAVAARDIADEFEVTERVAAVALDELVGWRIRCSA